MQSVFSILIHASTADDVSEYEYARFQALHLECFFHDVYRDSVFKVSGGKPPKDICTWPGHHPVDSAQRNAERAIFKCYNGVLTAMHISACRDIFCRLRIEYVPSTLELFRCESCGVSGTLHVRSFPREAQVLSLYDNGLVGPVDLSAIPRKLVILDLSKNALWGELHFDWLPPQIKELHLRSNEFKINALKFSRLPRTLRFISVKDPKRIDAVDPSKKPRRLKITDSERYTSLQKNLSLLI